MKGTPEQLLSELDSQLEKAQVHKLEVKQRKEEIEGRLDDEERQMEELRRKRDDAKVQLDKLNASERAERLKSPCNAKLWEEARRSLSGAKDYYKDTRDELNCLKKQRLDTRDEHAKVCSEYDKVRREVERLKGQRLYVVEQINKQHNENERRKKSVQEETDRKTGSEKKGNPHKKKKRKKTRVRGKRGQLDGVTNWPLS